MPDHPATEAAAPLTPEIRDLFRRLPDELRWKVRSVPLSSEKRVEYWAVVAARVNVLFGGAEPDPSATAEFFLSLPEAQRYECSALLDECVLAASIDAITRADEPDAEWEADFATAASEFHAEAVQLVNNAFHPVQRVERKRDALRARRPLVNRSRGGGRRECRSTSRRSRATPSRDGPSDLPSDLDNAAHARRRRYVRHPHARLAVGLERDRVTIALARLVVDDAGRFDSPPLTLERHQEACSLLGVVEDSERHDLFHRLPQGIRDALWGGIPATHGGEL